MTQSPATPLPVPKERRRLRESRSLTQADMATRLGVSRATVRSWEAGRSAPRGRMREAYTRLLAADPADARPEMSTPQEDVTPEDVTPELVGAGRGTGKKRSARVGERPRRNRAEGRLTEGWLTEDGHSGLPEPSLTPAQAFDALYAFCAPALVRQAYLLTGRRELARESVERAFQEAWYRWPEVAVDPDPAGWVRATAYEYALSPWHRLRPRYRHPEAPPSGVADRALLDVLLELPPVYRRALVLYDGVGLGLPETAAETEASTPAAANRVLHAREAVAARLPELSSPEDLHRRLAELASAERLRAAKPRTVRWYGERRAQQWTRAAIAFTVLLIGVTALTLGTAPDHYEEPLAPPETIHGLPPKAAPGPLSAAELKLRARLRSRQMNGPERLIPENR
ncbi:sigma factor-like helix-turn-helix DNA-binding protein [Streptomyces sp. NBC_00151]|uniref:sigma factor-like helix-turn-helix DNA-binding protein n=1 Tax=Streptomyces sp. NBC_00151 TaxID=2975669 RepID=UPI002DDB44D6|nr:sigma factor-like helix-turn-helix DNA-binding protein [Streptomyces sp. NBC_00151]WRZ39887.1 helix-turn-helix domain-containing protein [Streptomyces sp. NBC_00151]